jgi:hypothetical protein
MITSASSLKTKNSFINLQLSRPCLKLFCLHLTFQVSESLLLLVEFKRNCSHCTKHHTPFPFKSTRVYALCRQEGSHIFIMKDSTFPYLSTDESAQSEKALSVANNELEHSQQSEKEKRKSATLDFVSTTRKMVPLVLYDSESTLSEKTPVVTSPIEAPTEFILFPELPPELRLRIWHFAAKDPELQRVVLTLAKKTVNGKNIGYLKTVTSPPPMLHVCHDAREETSKNYTKAFKSLGENGEVVEMAYVAPLLDTIIVYLSDWAHIVVGAIRDHIPTTSAWQPTTHSMLEVALKRSADSRRTSKKEKCLVVFPRSKSTQSQSKHSLLFGFSSLFLFP